MKETNAIDWDAHVEREERRYRDGEARLPHATDSDARQRQLTRLGNAANGAALAALMVGHPTDAETWFVRAAEHYRESFVGAPPGSWGRPIGALKARILAGDWSGASADARWTLELGAAGVDSPIARYAATLAALVLEDYGAARVYADELRTHEGFPTEVGDALAFIAAEDVLGYITAAEDVLASFEARDEYLEDVPAADTVLVLQALAGRRAMAAELSSPLLPAAPAS